MKVNRAQVLRRFLELTRFFAWVFFRYLALRRASAEETEKFYVAIRTRIENSGATLIKLGQFFAMRIDLIPRPLCEQLLRLMDQVPPFPYEEVESIFREELKRAPDECFEVFKRRPFASASFAQVHAAQLPDGTDVVVKIQRPQLRQQVARDIRILRSIARILDFVRLLGLLKTLDIIEEFEDWTRDELDYRIEADYTNHMHRNARSRPRTRIPRVFWDLSTSRVLTLEYLEGASLAKLIRCVWRGDDEKTQDILDKYNLDLPTLASRLVDNSLQQMFDDDLFHADLHPANVILMKDDQIGYVDFGIMGTIEPDYRDSLLLSMEGFAAKDSRKVIQCLLEVSRPAERTDRNAVVSDLSKNIENYLRSLDKIHADLTQRSLGSLMFANIQVMARHHMVTPVNVVRFFRTVWMLDTLCLMLIPDFDITVTFGDYLRCRIENNIRQALKNQGQWLLNSYQTLRLLQEAPDLLWRILQKSAGDTFLIEDYSTQKALGSFENSIRLLSRLAVLLVLLVACGFLALFGPGFEQIDPRVVTAARILAPAFLLLISRELFFRRK